MSKHWGEIDPPSSSDFSLPDVTADIEKAMDKCCLAEYENDSDRQTVGNISLPPLDPLISYAISLHKYASDMTEMIRVAELATEMNLIPPEDAAPPMPMMPEIELKHKRNNLNFIPKETTAFTEGEHVQIPMLSEAIVKKILAKCIAAMFAHIGYETTHQSVLDVMIDVLESFFEKFCQKVIDSAEDSCTENPLSYPSNIEKVLIETGMGGVRGLHDYYQIRVVNYVNVLQRRCLELNEHYAVLLIPKSPSPSDKYSSIVRVKVDEDAGAVEIENPEFHFASLDIDSAVLESGLQLLHSLEEAEENLQGLEDTNDDEAISASPGVVSIPPDGDVSSLFPFAKKKRLK
uniref:Uncharacterized protein LOC114336410 n=1 Tax=Diabrotica virgifera virgifera TaxID=50390 RepID=A0A6P7G6D3_DIAVI